MKKTIAAIVILFAVWFAWSAWPFLALYDLVRAAQAADVAAIERGVDFPELRRSLSSQIIQAYARDRQEGRRRWTDGRDRLRVRGPVRRKTAVAANFD